jgi:hypothetical protein
MNNKILEYTSPLGISGNHYMSYRVIKNGNKSFVSAYPSKEYISYKKEMLPYLKQLIKDNDWQMINEFKHYYLDLIIYFDSTSKDPTNFFKILQDIGNQVIWYDDKILLGRVHRVYYTYNEQCKPRIECKLTPVEYIGIWDSLEEYAQFIDKCKMCRNFKNGQCKRLNEYMSYKITEDFDVDKRECLGFKMAKSVVKNNN